MSGGSWDYLYNKVEDAADRLDGSTCEHRRAFGKLVAKVADALHAIEWVDSCDYAPNDEIEPIKKALGENAETLILAEVIKEAEDVKLRLDNAIYRTKEIK